MDNSRACGATHRRHGYNRPYFIDLPAPDGAKQFGVPWGYISALLLVEGLKFKR
jgi:hypothetical protein